MPIVHCIVDSSLLEVKQDNNQLVALWSEYSGKSAEQMTINLLENKAQSGKSYFVMAILYLPSLWSQDSVDALQLGLSKALAKHFSVTLNDIQIITQIVQSGLVVEKGEIQTW